MQKFNAPTASFQETTNFKRVRRLKLLRVSLVAAMLVTLLPLLMSSALLDIAPCTSGNLVERASLIVARECENDMDCPVGSQCINGFCTSVAGKSKMQRRI